MSFNINIRWTKFHCHDNWNLWEISIRKSYRHYMEHWTRFKCILTKNIFLIVDLLDYCNYFDIFKYGLLYSENDFKHWDIPLVKVKWCNLIERNLWQIQLMVVIKICLCFASLSVYLPCFPSHNGNQFLPLLFQIKRTANIYIFALILHVIS